MLFKNIETKRLILKNISTDDREFIFNQFSNDMVNRYLFDAEPLINIEDADELINFYIQPEPRLQHRWIIIRKSDGVKMGTCGYHCWNQKNCKVEVGYDLQEEFWGNGYMQESMRELITFAINYMNIKEIYAYIYVENQRSIHLVEKLGFALIGSSYEIFRNRKYLHNIYSRYISNLT
ncbi:GNAT family N-acetyltransferase [Clostridium ihumii]|uniref:GNAT family N-acetyltransferase n=1 Tax=Clostridium ihumii TaxID=1470356 RepID=UPI000590509C|nr:GNAT family N-acetyltransferase [Clostridium ihumii]